MQTIRTDQGQRRGFLCCWSEPCYVIGTNNEIATANMKGKGIGKAANSHDEVPQANDFFTNHKNL
jgi:hypothetical protein